MRDVREMLRRFTLGGARFGGLGRIGSVARVECPLGAAVQDRWDRRERAWVVPLLSSGGPVGAVAAWTADGAELSGAALAGFESAIGAAAPRLEARSSARRSRRRRSAIRSPDCSTGGALKES